MKTFVEIVNRIEELSTLVSEYKAAALQETKDGNFEIAKQFQFQSDMHTITIKALQWVIGEANHTY